MFILFTEYYVIRLPYCMASGINIDRLNIAIKNYRHQNIAIEFESNNDTLNG